MANLEKYLINELSGKHHMKFVGIDQVGEFWVVLIPTEDSILEDILFEANIFDMHLQFLGGLKASDIMGIYKNKAKAKKVAENLLKV